MGAPRDPLMELWNRVFELGAREAIRLIFGIEPQPRGKRQSRRLHVPSEAEAFRAYASLGVLPSAPRTVIEAAYRALAKAAHPDIGGSPERMKDLNAAIAAIRKERRWKA